jgi:hypothetical protein
MNEYWIITTGQGMLPAGRKVGFIIASSPEAADDALIRSKQIPPQFKGHFGFEPKSAS